MSDQYCTTNGGPTTNGRVSLFVLFVLIMATVTAMTGCKPGDYNTNLSLNVRDAAPEEKARAAVIEADADAKMKENQISYDRAQATIEIEKKTLPMVAAANNMALLMKTNAESDALVTTTKADADAQVAEAQAKAQAALATGLSKSVVVASIGLGVGLSIPILMLAGTFYLGALLITAYRQINARARVVVVTAYFNRTRIDYLIMQDEGGRWHIQNTLEDDRGLMANDKAVSHVRPHLLQAAQTQWQHEQEQIEQEGLVTRMWAALFGRRGRRPQVTTTPIPARKTIEVKTV